MLLRAGEPVCGVELMAARLGQPPPQPWPAARPASARPLGLAGWANGAPLDAEPLQLCAGWPVRRPGRLDRPGRGHRRRRPALAGLAHRQPVCVPGPPPCARWHAPGR